MNGNNLNMVYGGLQQPWLSIIIPVYNAEKFICKCLDSIQGQTYSNFEALLIDDGSTDMSSSICQNYSFNDRRFHYIRKDNGGAYQSRIYGAERASGTYITFCDADDFYARRNAFACLYEEITKSNCQAMQFGYIKKYNHLSHKDAKVKKSFDTDKVLFFSHEYPILLCSFWKDSHLTTSVWNKVYHRSLLSNLPASESAEKVFWGDDLIINLHLLSDCQSFRFIPDTLYCYRQFSGGTNSFSIQTMKDLDNIKKYQLLYWERYQGVSKEIIKKILFSEVAGWFFYYVQQALEHLNEEELVSLINGILQYPRFRLAREYYLNNPEENRESVNLLQESNAHEYIQKAKERQNQRKMKEAIKKILKRIYASI